LQGACFKVYNDWLIDYCRVAPDRLVGVSALSVYNPDEAVRELERCKKAGLKGAIIWEVPHPDLPLHSEKYEPFWNALEELDMPLSLHILTGFSYFKRGITGINGIEGYRGSVNLKLADATNALFDLVWYGVLHRHPKLKLVLVEHEVGWLPFLVQQWDYYYRRFKDRNPPPFSRAPGEYVHDQVFATFFNDAVGARQLGFWGEDNCMWSNDFPHENSTWPNSRNVIDRDLGSLPEDKRRKIVCDTAANLYHLAVPAAV
jgi:predicted TIM-barrel fold metal-dependent hydrolase